jgi:hypothetical protein
LRKHDKRQRRLGMLGIARADITHEEVRQQTNLSKRVKRKISCGNAWPESRI